MQLREICPCQEKEPGKLAKSDNAWTVDDVVLAEEAGAMQISPDGKWALWIKRAARQGKRTRSLVI